MGFAAVTGRARLRFAASGLPHGLNGRARRGPPQVCYYTQRAVRQPAVLVRTRPIPMKGQKE